MNYLSVAWELLINLFEVIIFYLYISTILTPKKRKNWSLTLWGLLALRYFIVTIGNAFELLPTYTIIIGFTFNFLIARILYKENSALCVFWVGIHNVLSIIGELIAYFLLIFFTSMQPNEIMFGESYRFISTSLYIICIAGLNFIVSTAVSSKKLFDIKEKFFVFITMLMGIILTHSFMYIMVELKPHQSTFMNIIILANALFLCFFIFILVYIFELAQAVQKNKDLQERTRLLELETLQYNNLLNTTESLRAIKHDVHHHLATIQTLIRGNDHSRLAQYLDEYEAHFDLDYYISTTGNIVIDSILSEKRFTAKQQNTNLEFSFILPDSIPFSDVALSALLGNLFDNALEACKYLSPEQERWVHFQMKIQEDMLVIHIENTFDGMVKKDKNDTYLSRKKEFSHGIGLKRVHTLIEDANGFMEIRHNNHIFTVHIMVPLEKTNEF